MIEDLRQQAGDSFGDENEEDLALEKASKVEAAHFLGMTPIQRLILAFMLFMMVCVMGAFFLIVMDVIYLPF